MVLKLNSVLLLTTRTIISGPLLIWVPLQPEQGFFGSLLEPVLFYQTYQYRPHF